ncbi:uncharacterized protein JCM10292_000533 [Rhodotorula paludigena]|uniref:uncharacterized protein n=1 Tax=Rhodotorula paludigena TaxID=86838 RepID=UPI00316D4A1C
MQPPPAHTPNPAKARSPPPPASVALAPHLADRTDSLHRRCSDLEQYQIPQLAQCQGPLAFHNELAAGVRAELAACKRDVEELKLDVDDLERARDRAAAAHHVQAIVARIDHCTKLYRQAVVASKRQINAYGHLAARDELLSSSQGPAGDGASGRGSPSPYGAPRGGTQNQSADDALMSVTSDVTEGLRRTLQLMQQEVDRSLVSNELLESQTQTMEMTSTQYSTLSSLLHTSRALITSLERSNILDRLVLFGAFAFFVAVCAHIFKKRVLDRGVRVASAFTHLGSRAVGVVRGGGSAHDATDAVAGEVRGELARVVGAASAAAGIARQAVEKLRARAFSPAEGDEQDEVTVPGEGFVPPPVDEERRVAQPIQPSEEASDVRAEDELPAQEEPAVEPVEDEDVFYDAPLPGDTVQEPETATSAPQPTDEPAPSPPPAPPAEPADTPSEPRAQLPLDEVPAPEDGQGLFEVGDADLKRDEAQAMPLDAPAREAEHVLLRGEHPPEPTRDAEADVEFERGPRGPREPVEGVHVDEEEGEEKVFEPLDRLRPTRPDLDEQLDAQRVVADNAVPPAPASPVEEEAESADVRAEELPLPPAAEEPLVPDHELDLAGESTTAPSPTSHPGPPADEAVEGESTARLPLDDPALEPDTPAGLVARADEEARVGETHGGGPGGTRVLEGEELEALAHDGAEGAKRLEVDFEREVSLVPEEEEEEGHEVEGSPPAEPLENPHAREHEREHDEAQLLDDMFEAQFGHGGAVGGFVANETAVAYDEPADAYDEPADAYDEPADATNPATPSVEEPTAATTLEPTPIETDSASATPEPPVSAAPEVEDAVASEVDEELYEGQEAEAVQDQEVEAPAPAPPAEAEAAPEPTAPSAPADPAEDGEEERAWFDEEQAHLEQDDDEHDELAADRHESSDNSRAEFNDREESLEDERDEEDEEDDGDRPDLSHHRSEHHEAVSAFSEEAGDAEEPSASPSQEPPSDNDIVHGEDTERIEQAPEPSDESPLEHVPQPDEATDHSQSEHTRAEAQHAAEAGDIAVEPDFEPEEPSVVDGAEHASAYEPEPYSTPSDDEYVLPDLDDEVANSDVVYPDASVEEDYGDAEADDLPDVHNAAHEEEPPVFASAADESVEDRVGEDRVPASGHAADEMLHHVEEVLDDHAYDPSLEDESFEAYSPEQQQEYGFVEEERAERDEADSTPRDEL